MFRLPRRLCAALLLTLSPSVVCFSPTPAFAGPTAPQTTLELKVGDELLARRDVSLQEATLRKGSRVRIVQIEQSRGQAANVSLELKDGHVLRKVSIQTVRASFRRAPAPKP